MKIELTDVSDCTCYDSFNRTFYLPCTSNDAWGQDALGGIYLELVYESSDYILRCSVGGMVFEKNYGNTKPNCNNFLNESLSYVSSTNCNGSIATCTVSATDDECTQVISGACDCFLGNLPREIAVTPRNLANSNCLQCTSYNDTFILSYVEDPAYPCSWTTSVSGGCLYGSNITAWIDPDTLGIPMYVSIYDGDLSDRLDAAKQGVSWRDNVPDNCCLNYDFNIGLNGISWMTVGMGWLCGVNPYPTTCRVVAL